MARNGSGNYTVVKWFLAYSLTSPYLVTFSFIFFLTLCSWQ